MKTFKLYFSKPGSKLLVAFVKAPSLAQAVSGFKYNVHRAYQVNSVGAIIG